MLGSLKLTLVLLVVLLLALLVAYSSVDSFTRSSDFVVILCLPFAGLALNLSVAIVCHPTFRQHPALLVFHLCLLALIALAALGQLTNLKARAEISTGGWFEGQLLSIQAGPLHPPDYQALSFMNQGFSINYAPGPVRRHTANQIYYRDSAGSEQRVVVGDQVPFVLKGYRFYTSFNKGFAPLLVWRDERNRTFQGSVHLPAWPENRFNQAIEWTPPGASAPLWLQLDFDDVILEPERPSQFRLPREYQVIVRVGEARHQLVPGKPLPLAEGELVLAGLTTWMGYTVYYDQTRYWMLAAALLAVVSLSWHFWRKFNRTGWVRTH